MIFGGFCTGAPEISAKIAKIEGFCTDLQGFWGFKNGIQNVRKNLPKTCQNGDQRGFLTNFLRKKCQKHVKMSENTLKCEKSLPENVHFEWFWRVFAKFLPHFARVLGGRSGESFGRGSPRALPGWISGFLGPGARFRSPPGPGSRFRVPRGPEVDFECPEE